MRNFIIALLLINVFHNFAMEAEHTRLPVLPLEIVEIFEGFKVKECTQYKTILQGPGENCALPWTIPPVFLKYCHTNTPLHEDLTNPKPGDGVLPNAQLWTSRAGLKFRLSEDSRRTNDTYISPKNLSYNTCIYDGINKKNNALCVCKYYTDRPNPFYELYMFTQSNEFGQETKHQNLQPFFTGEGIVRSLMLENEYNKFMYSVNNAGSYSLIRQDLIEPSANTSDNVDYNQIILTTNEPFIKTVCLGKNTYFGITETGKLYSIWVDNTNNLICAEQKFTACPHTFIDISVDNTVRTEKGFQPKCAFLTNKGEIFTTHLDAYETPTLLYVTTVENPTDVKRLFYKNGQLSIIYKNSDEVLMWQDNFELRYFYALLKKLYNDTFV